MSTPVDRQDVAYEVPESLADDLRAAASVIGQDGRRSPFRLVHLAVDAAYAIDILQERLDEQTALVYRLQGIDRG